MKLLNVLNLLKITVKMRELDDLSIIVGVGLAVLFIIYIIYGIIKKLENK